MRHPIDNVTNSGVAVMDPFFGLDFKTPPNRGFFQWTTLQADDIAGIQTLYAAPAIAGAVPEPGTLLIWSLLGLTFARVAGWLRNTNRPFAGVRS
jgi:hypothetical protein